MVPCQRSWSCPMPASCMGTDVGSKKYDLPSIMSENGTWNQLSISGNFCSPVAMARLHSIWSSAVTPVIGLVGMTGKHHRLSQTLSAGISTARSIDSCCPRPGYIMSSSCPAPESTGNGTIVFTRPWKWAGSPGSSPQTLVGLPTSQGPLNSRDCASVLRPLIELAGALNSACAKFNGTLSKDSSATNWVARRTTESAASSGETATTGVAATMPAAATAIPPRIF